MISQDKGTSILVTGATGLVGSHLIDHLKEQGYTNIRGLSRNPDKVQIGSGSILKGDLLDIIALEDCLKGVSIVVHCAAMVSFNPKDKNVLNKTNVEGTANLINACLHNRVPSFIYISSVAALGKPTFSTNTTKEITLDEKQQWIDSPINSNYAKSKFEAECEVWRGEAEGLNVAVLNPSIILGEGDWSQSSSRLFKYVWDEQKFSTDGFINYVDVKDVAKAIESVISFNKYSSKYILNGGKVSYAEFFKKIADRFKKSPPRIKLGSFWINLLWRLEYLRSLIFGSDPLITKETSISAQSNFFFNNKKAKEHLGITFNSLDESLDRICTYYVSKN
jgi:dihydroflavonol-4-reductase